MLVGAKQKKKKEKKQTMKLTEQMNHVSLSFSPFSSLFFDWLNLFLFLSWSDKVSGSPINATVVYDSNHLNAYVFVLAYNGVKYSIPMNYVSENKFQAFLPPGTYPCMLGELLGINGEDVLFGQEDGKMYVQIPGVFAGLILFKVEKSQTLWSLSTSSEKKKY